MPVCMKTLFLSLTLLAAVLARAQLPAASPKAAGFDPARLEVLRATTQRFVDEGKPADNISRSTSTVSSRRFRPGIIKH